jgi:hypothetical protein
MVSSILRDIKNQVQLDARYIESVDMLVVHRPVGGDIEAICQGGNEIKGFKIVIRSADDPLQKRKILNTISMWEIVSEIIEA